MRLHAHLHTMRPSVCPAGHVLNLHGTCVCERVHCIQAPSFPLRPCRYVDNAAMQLIRNPKVSEW